jgi:2'-5' RNA ligase
MRLFVAIEFPEEIINSLTAVQQKIRGNVERGRFKRSENFHLTLKFLGEAPAAAVDRLGEQLSLAGKGKGEFSLRLGELGIFGARPPIRVIWQGLGGDTDRLYALQQSVEAACCKAGFARDKRPYSPHITLAQEVIPLPGKSYLPPDPPVPEFTVQEFALVLSEEKDRKRLYTPLRIFSL